MPELGWDAVTVPGAVDLWSTLSRSFGRLPFPDLFEPAIRYASHGFVVAPVTAKKWSQTQDLYRDFPDFAAAFLPGGRAPRPGELFRPQGLADTLKMLAETHGESLYRGELASRIVSCSRKTGGFFSEKDLAEHHTEWVKPLSQTWNGVTLHELPPNGQGLTVLIALGILKHIAIEQYPVDSPDSLHLQIEAMKRAFNAACRQIADPAWMTVSPSALLNDDFLKECADAIRMDRASFPSTTIPQDGGTVYLTAADEQGMMVSFIQSNYKGFGSGIVIPGTGISLQNRGAGFTLEEGHPNRVAGGKTALPHDHSRVCDEGGGASDELRCHGRAHAGPGPPPDDGPDLCRPSEPPGGGGCAPLVCERGFPSLAGAGLRDRASGRSSKKRGHILTEEMPTSVFGGAQIIYRLTDGYCAASDPRKDGQAVGY